MDNQKLKYQIFDLTTNRFVELCHDLLKAEFDYDKTVITDAKDDKGIDILALKGVEEIAIQVKHKYKLSKENLEKELNKYVEILEAHHKFIYITSAKIEKNILNKYESNEVSIIPQNEPINLLDKHPDISQSFFLDIEHRSYWRGWFGFSRNEEPKGIIRLNI